MVGSLGRNGWATTWCMSDCGSLVELEYLYIDLLARILLLK